MVSRLLSAHFRLGQEGTHDDCQQELQVGVLPCGASLGQPETIAHCLQPSVGPRQASAIESPNKDYSEATAVRAYRSPRLL